MVLLLLRFSVDGSFWISSGVTQQVWAESFGHLLALREKTQHAQCSQCLRHKYIIKKLSQDRNARQAQLRLYSQHLQQQYSDRTQYWRARSNSRLRTLTPSGSMVICIILDAIDHTKFRFPRSAIFSAKDLSTHVRPCMETMGVLCHGHSAQLILTEPHVRKGSSFCADLLLHTVSKCAARGIDNRTVSLHIQSDNTSKETKNNTQLRLAALLTALHRVKRCDIQNLMTGHSHEDVDQWFATITAVLEAHPELHVPQDFVHCLNQYLRDPSSRPHEPERQASMVESTRDWIHGFSLFRCNVAAGK